jgi:hypothetical protein
MSTYVGIYLIQCLILIYFHFYFHMYLWHHIPVVLVWLPAHKFFLLPHPNYQPEDISMNLVWPAVSFIPDCSKICVVILFWSWKFGPTEIEMASQPARWTDRQTWQFLYALFTGILFFKHVIQNTVILHYFQPLFLSVFTSCFKECWPIRSTNFTQ